MVSGQKHANKPIPTDRDREIKREETGKAKETKGEGVVRWRERSVIYNGNRVRFKDC